MIDWQRVNTLRNDVGPDDFSEIVDLFLEEVDEMVARLKAKPDPATLAADLHCLKGSAQGLGFRAFSELCQKGETYCATAAPRDVEVAPILQCYADSRHLFLEQLPGALAG